MCLIYSWTHRWPAGPCFKSYSYCRLRPQLEIPDNPLLPPLPPPPSTTFPFSVGSNIIVFVPVNIDAESASAVIVVGAEDAAVLDLGQNDVF